MRGVGGGDEVELNVLIIRYGLDCTAQLYKGDHYRINISSKSMPRLKEIVGPYMHESMLYKLSNGV